MDTHWKQSWPLSKTLACTAAAAVLFLGTRGLYQTTEGRYAECARQTLVSGHWLDPVLNGHPHWTKPPLTYLAIIAPMRAFGVNTWTARAYLVPSLLLAVWGVWLLGRHLARDKEVGNLAALVFATSAFPLASSTVISTDYPLAALLILAQAVFWQEVREPSRRGFVPVWVLLGLAFMTKGPPSLLPLPAMIVAWRLLPEEQRRRSPFFHPLGLALYAAIALPWYIWEVLRHPGLLRYWVHDEVIERAATDHFGRNPHFYSNFTLYLPVLLFGCWPWGGWLMALRGKAWAAGAAALAAAGGGGWGARAATLWEQVRAWSLERRWSVWAFGFPLAVFALSRSKLPLYVLPLFGPLSVFVAQGLMRAYAGNRATLWRWAGVAALGCWALSVGAKAVVPLCPTDRDMKRVYRAIVSQVPEFDGARLAVYSGKQLNGLQFYVQRELLHSYQREELQQWAKAGGVRYFVLKKAETKSLQALLPASKITWLKLLDDWLLAVVPPAAE